MPSPTRIFGKHFPIEIPAELATETVLMTYLGVSEKELNKIWWSRTKMYKTFSITKAPGKFRHITAPDKRLKMLQRKIALLLDKIYKARKPVHGFLKDRSVKTNAQAHIERKYILNIDLKDFFNCITENRIIGLFQAIGIDSRVSEILARLCCYKGHLPQGAPTSPVISNMICFRLDSNFLEYAKSARAIYTRYADDITFSTYQPNVTLFKTAVPLAGPLTINDISNQIVNIINANGFSINESKIHYADRHSRRIVTGLKINEMLNLDRRYIRNLRAILHSVEKLGLKAAQDKFFNKTGRQSDISKHLVGRIAWLYFVKGTTDPLVRGIISRFKKNFPAHPIELKLTENQQRDRAVWIIEHDGENGTQGSCFFLKDIGIVTAAHCVKNISSAEIYHPTKPANKFLAKISKVHVERDIAILESEIPNTEYFELKVSSSLPVEGLLTSALGYPDFGPGDKLNIRPGSVSSLPIKHGVQLLEVTQRIWQGMSGGPLLDPDGNVLGINHKGGPSNDRNFATYIKELINWNSQ